MRHITTLVVLGTFIFAGCSSQTVDSSGIPVTEATNPVGPTPVEVAHSQIGSIIRKLKEQDGAELLRNLQVLVRTRELALEPIAVALPNSDARTKANLCYVLGGIGGSRAAQIAMTALSDPDKGVRYEAASALATMGDTTGYPVLVGFLADPDRRVRYKTIETLRETTKQDLGFNFNATESEQAAAIGRWKQWLKDVQTQDLRRK